MSAPRLVFEFAIVMLFSWIVASALELFGFRKSTLECAGTHALLVATAYCMWLSPLIDKLGKNL